MLHVQLRWRLQVKLRRSALSHRLFCALRTLHTGKLPWNHFQSLIQSTFSVSKLLLVKDVLRSIVNLDLKQSSFKKLSGNVESSCSSLWPSPVVSVSCLRSFQILLGRNASSLDDRGHKFQHDSISFVLVWDLGFIQHPGHALPCAETARSLAQRQRRMVRRYASLKKHQTSNCEIRSQSFSCSGFVR